MDIYISTVVSDIHVVSFIFLHRLLGVSALGGFILLVLAVPMSKKLTSLVMDIAKNVLSAKDYRMQLVNEFFSSVSLLIE